jgi:hypothetical protein
MKIGKAALFGLFVLVLLDAGASAQTATADATVIGIHLGGKFALPECEREIDSTKALLKKMRADNLEMAKRTGDAKLIEMEIRRQGDTSVLGGPDRYAVQDPPSICYEWPDMETDYVDANTPVVTAHVKITLPADKSPAILAGLQADAQVVNGTLESVWFITRGLQSQDLALATLEEKYGKPTRLKEDRKQNAFGAFFISHYAEWRFANLTVVFWGAVDSVDHGFIRIDTKKGSAFRAASLKSFNAGPKL